MSAIRLIFVLQFVFCASCAVTNDNLPKIIIDNDAGGDDAMAIFLGLLYEKHFNGPKVIGLTTASGNTYEDNVSVNNQRILKVAKRQDVPIYKGSKSAIVHAPNITDYYGKDGLGDIDEVITGLQPPKEQGAVSALIELSKIYEGRLTVVTLGPVTNVALAIKMDADFLSRLSHLFIAAGHIHDENLPDAEFNANMDVEAYQIIVEKATPDKVTVLPFSQVMTHLNLSREWRQNVLGAINTDIIRAQNLYERIPMEHNERWQSLDPAAVAIAVRSDLVDEYRYSKSDINLCGDKRGITNHKFVEKNEANVRIAYKVNLEKYKQFLLDVFALE